MLVLRSRYGEEPLCERCGTLRALRSTNLSFSSGKARKVPQSSRPRVLSKEGRRLPRENKRSMKPAMKRPTFVTVKFAQSLDGRIATAAGESKWISGTAARRFVHKLRSEHDAILVGIGTVLTDDPELTVRLARGRNPLRVIIDTHLRIPLTARVLAEGAAGGTLIVAGKSADKARAADIKSMGAEVLRLPQSKDKSGIDLNRLLEELGRRGIASVFVEGGKGIITSLLRARAVDRLIAVIAPKIIGQGIEAVGDLGISKLGDAIVFSSIETRRLGPDLIFDGRISRDGR
ncbi:MAG TPA: bifunctional diaminohydroxyphosphoribosylaminopyrimidine deaminase/5-amino-6-(5-phosphoribosylamino)uracil reductase RibD [Blastocatellia bacterium]|nr:bifunctional diaminohydroxyphosphoribosylaminopyrimidine deaminase/5-amino-6-(5-phosphoribosylamino)uracil reductase RibD [Blastocatellia bacterium]